MSKILDNLLYTEDHEWALVEGTTVTLGITDFAQSSLGDIVFVELPDVDSTVDAGESFGVVESIKSVSDLYSPITGNVLEKNEEVESSPELLNTDSYGNWLLKIQVTDKSQLDALMDAQAYKNYCAQNN